MAHPAGQACTSLSVDKRLVPNTQIWQLTTACDVRAPHLLMASVSTYTNTAYIHAETHTFTDAKIK